MNLSSAAYFFAVMKSCLISAAVSSIPRRGINGAYVDSMCAHSVRALKHWRLNLRQKRSPGRIYRPPSGHFRYLHCLCIFIHAMDFEQCLTKDDLLRFCDDDMRFVFIYNSLFGQHVPLVQKTLDEWITRLKRTFDEVTSVQKETYDLVKCSFSHQTLSFCILELNKSHEKYQLTYFEFH